MTALHQLMPLLERPELVEVSHSRLAHDPRLHYRSRRELPGEGTRYVLISRRAKTVQVVGPRLHHDAPLPEVLRIVVVATDRV